MLLTDTYTVMNHHRPLRSSTTLHDYGVPPGALVALNIRRVAAGGSDHGCAPGLPPSVARIRPGPPVEAKSEELLDVAVVLFDTYLGTLGLASISSPRNWAPADARITKEFTVHWPQSAALAAKLDFSARHNVARLVTVCDGCTLVRLVTPHNSWFHSIDHASAIITCFEPEPTPITGLPFFANALHYSSMVSE
jgi:hypothetical protein